MKVLVAANHVPFIHGGAEYHIQGLLRHLRESGCQAEALRLPFWFQPESDIQRLMAFCRQLKLNAPNNIRVDKLISLQFPAWGIEHNNHTAWIMHQHRGAYELYSAQQASTEQQQFRQQVVDFDNATLGAIQQRFANSQRVAQRLRQYNHLSAQPLYHPPHGAAHFYSAAAQGYIFCPSRLESLKRQDLLIQAARYLTTGVKILIAGEGGQRSRYQQLIEQYHLQDRVRLLGHISEAEKYTFYAHALAVFFAPFDEDYGYITLESQLSAKPVLTCEDSGGPLEFVEHQQNGYILPPQPQAIAQAIDDCYRHPQRARDMGHYGQQCYQQKNIHWDHVIQQLLDAHT